MQKNKLDVILKLSYDYTVFSAESMLSDFVTNNMLVVQL